MLVKSDKILAKWRKLTLTKIKIDKIFIDKVSNSGLSFKFCWFWIFRWIKLYWHSCSMWDRPGWLNWFWQHLSEVIFLNLKGVQETHMHGFTIHVKDFFFCTGLISKKLCRFFIMFSTAFTSLSVLNIFPQSITFFVFVHGFWFYFI